jgi:transposase
MGEAGVDVGAPRLLEAERRQLRWEAMDLESLVAPNHRARVIWAAVERLELRAFYDEIRARGSAPGRPAIDPKILLALWLYATSEGVGSARHLERLCERDAVYRWICGGVVPSYHTLSDFRVEHGEKLDGLLSEVLAALMSKGLVSLRRVAQDGMRVRASAGAASFRRGSTLERCLAEAEAQVEGLKRELEEDPSASTARERAARERAARQRQEGVERALAELAKVQEVRERSDRAGKSRRRKGSGTGEARVSTTDPEARVMKMGDGGYRPAFNVQYATDTESRMIVGVDVTNHGTDTPHLVPMLDQIEKRTNGRRPEEYLVDGGFASLAGIDEAESRGIVMYAPPPAPRSEGIDPTARKRDDTDRTAAWRQRMGTDEAQKIYRERGATAETINADQRAWRGMRQFAVRGLGKVRCVALLMALLHNVLRASALQALAT